MLCAERINPIDRPGRPRSTDLPSGEAPFRLTALVFEALVIHGMKQDAIAALLGYSPSYLTLIKKGEKPLPLDRVWLLPEEVRATFFALGAGRTGQRVVRSDSRKRAIGKLLAAFGEAVEELDEDLPLLGLARGRQESA